MVSSTQNEGGLEHLTETAYHELLADEKRRIVLDALSRSETPLGLEALAELVATRQRDDADTERVAICLHHVHLPKMDDLGIIDYDPKATRIHTRRN